MSQWVGVVGALVGAIIGAAATFLAQWAQRRSEREERRRDARRVCYTTFLTATHEMYTAINSAYRRFAAAGDRPALKHDLAEISPDNGQAALEAIRLTASGSTVEGGVALWNHMRGGGIPQGGGGSIFEWKRRYWDLRRSFTDEARSELGVSAGPRPVGETDRSGEGASRPAPDRPPDD